jgi:CubicO group peptidase (beta-lactamase class C family)
MRIRYVSATFAALALSATACSSSAQDRVSSTQPAPDTGASGDVVVASTDSATTATVAPPTSTAAPTPPALRTYDFSMISPVVQQFVDERALEGAGLVVVDEQDGVVHEEYWGEFNADRISLIASSSKMIVAGVLMALDDQGLLDIDAPVADVVEWGAGHPSITPAQLVSNSSGLVGLGPNPAYAPYICQFRPEGTLAECAEAIFTTDQDEADVVPPDSGFRYGGGQWQVAGAVAEAASGRSWAELIDDTYIEPCGVESLGFNNQWAQFGRTGFTYPGGFNADPTTLAPSENPNMEGGAYITAPDYGELLLLHLRGGRCGDQQVLSSAAIDRTHADRIGEVYDGSAGGKGYGMGWWIDRDTGRLSDPGAYGSTPWLDLDDNYGVYLVVEADGATGSALADLLADPINEVMSSTP